MKKCMLMAIVLAFALTAGAKRVKSISRTSNYMGMTLEKTQWSFLYDNSGRIVQSSATTQFMDGVTFDRYFEYEYGDHTIRIDCTRTDYSDYENRVVDGVTTDYCDITLNDEGLIATAEWPAIPADYEKTQYTYDLEHRLIMADDIPVIWKDGNIKGLDTTDETVYDVMHTADQCSETSRRLFNPFHGFPLVERGNFPLQLTGYYGVADKNPVDSVAMHLMDQEGEWSWLNMKYVHTIQDNEIVHTTIYATSLDNEGVVEVFEYDIEWEEDTQAGITSVTGPVAATQYWGMSGMKVRQPARGLNIVKLPDGSIKKVNIKH